MKGTVTNVTSAGENIQFTLIGELTMSQYPPESRQPVKIEVHDKHGITATVSQAKPLFAMTTNWGAGALRTDGALLDILKKGAESGTTMKFELSKPKLDFGHNQTFTLTHAMVVRATDVNLH